MYKILYFGSFDKPYDTEEYISKTLESLGHTVERYPTTRTKTALLQELLTYEWDAIILSKGWFPDPRAQKMMEAHKGLKIGWFWDLCWGTPRENLISDHHLFRSDIVLTSDGGHDKLWEKAKVNHDILRQGIFEPEAILGRRRPEYVCDVAFVGSLVHQTAFGWAHRSELFNFLRDAYGDRFKHFGTDKNEIRNLRLNDLYASAKVVVGDSVYSSNYWSNRLYETTGRGGFLIFPAIDGLEKEFTYYKHIIPYEYYDFAGLKEKIDYYVKNDKERDEIRLAGFEHCKKHHTYTIRCKELIKIIGNYATRRTQNRVVSKKATQ